MRAGTQELTPAKPRSPNKWVMSVASVITVISERVARTDSAHVCQFQLADMAELADKAEKPLQSKHEETADGNLDERK